MASIQTQVIVSTPALLHTGAGYLQALLASHTQGAAETIILYDNTSAAGTPLLTLNLAAGTPPFTLFLSNHHLIQFTTGLYIDPGKCNVRVWLIA